MSVVERYRVEHETRYAYRVPVSQSWQLAHLTPRALPWQRVLSHELKIEPASDERREERDAFGNGVTHFAVYAPHPLLRVSMSAAVEVGERPDPAVAGGLAWEAVREAVRGDPAQDNLAPARLSEPSALVPWSEAARAYAAPSFGAGRDWLEAIVHLRRRIHADFEFEPGATTVSTQVDEVLEQRSGVCQDFAHVMLACLRGQGLPARYVSGYLRTDPPPGRARLLGVDASHAWVAAYSPKHGWVELDPTNDTRADQRYITLAWGADFADVVPLRGVILGGRGQSMGTAVSVIPEGEDGAPPLKGAPRGGGEPDLGGMARAGAGRNTGGSRQPGAAFMSHAAASPLSLQPIVVRRDEPTRPRPEGPGWFDSSWELRAGLRVEEGLPADLGVCAWIETWLQLAAAGASPSLSAT